MKKFIAMLMLILGSFAFGESVSLKVGDKIPDFKIQSIDGKKILDTKTLKGKEILINFTASWCPTCIAEKIEFQKDYEKYFSKNKNLEIVVISGDYGRETPETVKQYMKENNYTYPSYYDNNKEIAVMFGLKAVPTNILIDKNGTILEIGRNYYEVHALRERMK